MITVVRSDEIKVLLNWNLARKSDFPHAFSFGLSSGRSRKNEKLLLERNNELPATTEIHFNSSSYRVDFLYLQH